MSDEHDVPRSRTRVLMRRLLVNLVRQCNDFDDQPWDASTLAPGVMQVWALTGGLGDARQILDRIERASMQDQHSNGADGLTYQAVIEDLDRLRGVLGLER